MYSCSVFSCICTLVKTFSCTPVKQFSMLLSKTVLMYSCQNSSHVLCQLLLMYSCQSCTHVLLVKVLHSPSEIGNCSHVLLSKLYSCTPVKKQFSCTPVRQTVLPSKQCTSSKVLMAKKGQEFHLRVDADTMDAIETWAADEFRSTNGQLQWIITEALRREQKRLPKKKGERKEQLKTSIKHNPKKERITVHLS